MEKQEPLPLPMLLGKGDGGSLGQLSRTHRHIFLPSPVAVAGCEQQTPHTAPYTPRRNGAVLLPYSSTP